MEYTKISDLKVKCIVSQDDFDFFGISMDDLYERNDRGVRFLKKLKELCAMTQKITWTDTAYTLHIVVLGNTHVSMTLSEEIDDYIESLKKSAMAADKKTTGPLNEFISVLENTDEETARKLVARFEKNIKEAKLQ